MKDFIIIFVLILHIFVGIAIGWCACKDHTDYQHEQVGIERIVHCNNVHSNWYEIVWKTDTVK